MPNPNSSTEQSPRVFVVGLSGGIGSGKSTVAALLAEAGYPVVDADAIAREIVEPGEPVLAELAAEFGADILDDTGALRRAELAARAFASGEATAALNRITHPAIRARTQQAFAQAAAAGHPAVIYDMPLLVDNGWHRDMDLVVIVDVAAEERIRRLVHYRGLSESDARQRMAAQISDEQRRAAADIVIDNNGTREQLEAQLRSLIAEIDRRIAQQR